MGANSYLPLILGLANIYLGQDKTTPYGHPSHGLYTLWITWIICLGFELQWNFWSLCCDFSAAAGSATMFLGGILGVHCLGGSHCLHYSAAWNSACLYIYYRFSACWVYVLLEQGAIDCQVWISGSALYIYQIAGGGNIYTGTCCWVPQVGA